MALGAGFLPISTNLARMHPRAPPLNCPFSRDFSQLILADERLGRTRRMREALQLGVCRRRTRTVPERDLCPTRVLAVHRVSLGPTGFLQRSPLCRQLTQRVPEL